MSKELLDDLLRSSFMCYDNKVSYKWSEVVDSVGEIDKNLEERLIKYIESDLFLKDDLRI